MAIQMAKTIKEERMRWLKPIIEKEIGLVDLAKVCPHSKRSLERWLRAHREGGEGALEPKSTKPNTHPKETPIHIKEKVLSLRKETGLCAQKLHWRLQKQGLNLHPRTIGKILKAEGLVRKYRKKKVKYKYLRAERKPGELIEIDVKYVPQKLDGKRYFQYTAIDCASRWRYLGIYESQSTYHSILFLQEVMNRFPYPVRAIKTDNHAVFTNYYLGTTKRSDLTVKTLHALDRFCAEKKIIHSLIDPGRPAQNGTVERSHREDQRKVYTGVRFKNLGGLKKKVKMWNTEYNDLEHCGLEGKTPNEFLIDYKLTKPPKVRT
jgi:transposase InsO family protein